MALNDQRRAFASGPRGYLEALLMVAIATVAGLLVTPWWGAGSVDLLYLPAVLAAAVLRGLAPALAAAIVSTLSYNFFFTAPYRTFLVHSPTDLVTVIVLFLVAVVTSHLAASMREQARLAKAFAGRNATIAGLARRLLSCASEQAIAEVVVGEFSRLFDCNANLVIDKDDPHPVASAPANVPIDPGDHAAAMVALSTGKAAGRGIGQANLADWQFHPIVSGQEALAAIGLARNDGMPPVPDHQHLLLGSLLDQVALALERARLDREAREFATVRERDRIRSALVATIGEEVKPRLLAIMGAVRALRRSGSGDKELVSTIASETLRLDRYVDNLVDLSPASDRRPIDVGNVTIDTYQRIVRRDGKEVHLSPKEYGVLAELAKQPGRVLTHAHLLRAVWGPANERQVEYLRVAIRELRKKLEHDPGQPEIILNVPAVGYRLVPA
jgi:K+-sensing histidine kinase KdpD